MTTREEQIAAVMRQWNAHQEWLGKGYGPDLDTLRKMAEVAVMGLTAGRRWTVKDTVPDDAHKVGDEFERTWTRVVGGWSCFVLESRFPELVGDVYEIVAPPTSPFEESATRSGKTNAAAHIKAQQRAAAEDPPPRCAAHGDPGCGWCAQITQDGDDGAGGCNGCEMYAETGMHWDTCPYRVSTPPPIEAPATVVLDRTVVVGLVALLASVAAKLTRLDAAYKGPATKGADLMADECTQVAAQLRELAGGDSGA